MLSNMYGLFRIYYISIVLTFVFVQTIWDGLHISFLLYIMIMIIVIIIVNILIITCTVIIITIIIVIIITA